MRFEHKVTIEAPKQTVQDFLNDFNKSAYCVPGLKDLKDLGNDAYEGTIRVKIGPIGLNVGGKAQIERQAEGWHVKGEGNDRRVGASMTADVEAKIERDCRQLDRGGDRGGRELRGAAGGDGPAPDQAQGRFIRRRVRRKPAQVDQRIALLHPVSGHRAGSKSCSRWHSRVT